MLIVQIPHILMHYSVFSDILSSMIEHILFDLDNTLYSCSNEIDKKLTERMFRFIADFLSLSVEDAVKLQRKHRHKYGTTLEWLEEAHNLTDRTAFFEAIHPESELSELEPDPKLRGFLQSLDKPMTVLTNAPMIHAERVLDFFNIRDLFLGVFDITYHNCRGKPSPQCYLTTLKAVNKTLEETLFLDDYPSYVTGYLELGGKAVLVDETGRHTERCASEGIPAIRSIYELPQLFAAMEK